MKDRDDRVVMPEETGAGTSAEIDGLTKQVAKGGGIAFAGLFSARVISFFFQILLSRVLGASLYGIFALGYTIHNISMQILLLGLPNSVVRFGAIYAGEGDRRRMRGLLLTVLGVVVVSGVVGGALLYFLAAPLSRRFFDEPGLIPFLRIIAFSVPFYLLVQVFSASGRALKRMDYDVGIKDMLHPGLKFVTAGVAFLLGARLLGVAAALLIAAVVAAVMGFLLIRRLLPDIISDVKPVYETKKLAGFSVGVFLIGFSHLWLTQTDRVMLGYFEASASVGIYNAAAVLSSQVAVFLLAFNGIFAPVIADLYNRKKMTEFEATFKTTTKWIVTLTLPVTLVLVFYAQPIMGLFGSEFRAGWKVLVILSVAQLVNVGVGGVGYVLVMTGRQWLEFVNGIVLGILNIVLNIILIKRYGPLGAGLATGFSLMAVNLARLAEVYYFFRIHPYKMAYGKPLLAALGALTLTLVFRATGVLGAKMWILEILFLLLGYAAILVVMKLDDEDALVWKSVKEKFSGKGRRNNFE